MNQQDLQKIYHKALACLAPNRSSADRGCFLTFLIVLGILAGVINLFEIFVRSPNQELIFDFAFLSSLALVFLSIFLYLRIWRWKKWAVSGLFALMFLPLTVNWIVILVTRPPLPANFWPITLISLSVFLIENAFFAWALYRKWHLFK